MGSNQEAGLTISGQIIIPAIVPGFRGATAHIFLEELKGEDAAARIVAEEAIQGVRHESGGDMDTVVPFTIHIASDTVVVSSENDYNVRVWIDSNSNGRSEQGDLYSDERQSVLTGRSQGPVNIKVVQR